MRKVCFVITSPIHYSRSLLILDELKKHRGVDLHIAVGGTAVLPKYAAGHAHTPELLEAEGFKNIHQLHFNLEGSNTVSQAKTAGLAVIEFSSLFHRERPDLVVVRGDRFEVLSAALAAVNLNIPIAHIEGGDLSGTIDEGVRHAITKLAHFHFTTNPHSKRRVLRMGEPARYVFNFGSPDVELSHKLAGKRIKIDLEKTGSGAKVNPNEDFLMVMFHPVTTEVGALAGQTRELLGAVHELGLPALWFWPNFDAGAEEISHELRSFNDRFDDHRIRFMRFLPPQEFVWLLSRTRCLVGNSSAGFKECSYLGVPAVTIGTRQNRRLAAGNVVEAPPKKEKIIKAVRKQLERGRFRPARLYFRPDTSRRIAETIATAPLYIQKRFHE